MRILVIDDDVILAHGIQRMLRHGHEVAIDTDPIRGITHVANAEQTAPFDVVLCDLAMPHMDGFEVLDALHASPRRPKFVMMSGRKDVRAPGIDDVLVKPFSADDLETVLARVDPREHRVNRAV